MWRLNPLKELRRLSKKKKEKKFIKLFFLLASYLRKIIRRFKPPKSLAGLKNALKKVTQIHIKINTKNEFLR